MCSYNRSGYVYVPTIGLGVEGFIIVHVLTTGLGVAGFVLLLYTYLPQDWALQALCYCCTRTYHRTGCCRLCVIIVHVLTTGLGVAGFVLLLQCTYRRPGCCRLCVTVVHVLTTGLGVNQDNADLK